MATTFEQLFAASATVGGKDQQPGQSETEYLTELVRLLSTVADETWNGLSPEAQNWYNGAAQAINGNQPIPVCEGFAAKPQEAAPAKVPQQRKPRAPKAAAPAATPDVKKPGRAFKSSGVIDAIRKEVILHPDWNSKQLLESLQANGFPAAKIETIAVNAGDIRRTIAMARELGFWNDDNYAKVQTAPAAAPVEQPAQASA